MSRVKIVYYDMRLGSGIYRIEETIVKTKGNMPPNDSLDLHSHVVDTIKHCIKKMEMNYSFSTFLPAEMSQGILRTLEKL
ncbi:hypothetical protein C0J52_27693 [Blattella germanica]|nr:hypothetical protein C0J52_27693 [Blattella germanica]